MQKRSIVSVEDLTDPTAAGGEMLSQDLVHLGAQAFNARRVTILLDKCVVVFHTTSSRVRSHTTLPEEYMGFVAIGPNSRVVFDGRPMATEMMLVVEAGASAQLVVEPRHESISCLISPESLEKELHIRSRLGQFDWPRGAMFRRPESQHLRHFFDVGKRLVDAAARQPSLLEDSETARTLAEAEVMEALMATIASAEDAKPSRCDRTRREYVRIIESVQMYALRRCTRRVYVSDLCLAAHVSERTLQYAFREVTGLTPVAYLTRVRLHRARQALRKAAPGTKTVTAVAHDFGFWHLGEFSRLYKECFHDLPSNTLRRTD